MAGTNPSYGKIINTVNNDPNTKPPVVPTSTPGLQATSDEPTAGNTKGVPPYLNHPSRDTMLDTFSAPFEAGE